jgi:pSer/pThr/pTyr-binding forkhead associated (FHA) protein
MVKQRKIRIGRSKMNHYVVNDPLVGDVHAELVLDAKGNVVITDLGSPSGTFINNRRLLGYTILATGDQVMLGSRYRLDWQKLMGTSGNPRSGTSSPKVGQGPSSPPPISEKIKAKGNREAHMSVSNLSLILIYGGILAILAIMALIN